LTLQTGSEGPIFNPDFRRLLLEWAEKYKERFRWRLRSSFQTSNPLGQTPSEINLGLQSLLTTPYVFTGAAAATDTPFIDLDRIDIFLLPNQGDAKFRQLRQRAAPLEAPNSASSTLVMKASSFTPNATLFSRESRTFKRIWICMLEEAAI
jgi:hypothetical protein